MIEQEILMEIICKLLKKAGCCNNACMCGPEDYCLRCEEFTEELLKNGMIVTPCKIGDKVYKVYNNCDIVDYKVYYIKVLVDEDDVFMKISATHDNIDDIDFRKQDIGRSVFLSYEEAERSIIQRDER